MPPCGSKVQNARRTCFCEASFQHDLVSTAARIVLDVEQLDALAQVLDRKFVPSSSYQSLCKAFAGQVEDRMVHPDTVVMCHEHFVRRVCDDLDPGRAGCSVKPTVNTSNGADVNCRTRERTT